MIIAPGIHSLDTRKGGRVHAYIVEDVDGLTLIDTLYDADGRIILDYLPTIGRVPTDIKRICLTHSHKSHLGGLAAIKAASGAVVLAHEWEAPIIEGREKAKPVGYKPPRPFNAEVYALQIGLNIGLGKHEPVKVAWYLDEQRQGGRVGTCLTVLNVPGHTPGCVAFWDPARRVLIAGDTVATWPQLDRGWPTFNLDPAAAGRSIGKMADLEPEVLCVGHGDPIVAGATEALQALQP